MNSTWATVMTGQSPQYVDWMLMLLFTLAAVTQYTSITVSGMGRWGWRGPVAIGWSLWSVRFWWAFLHGDDPVVPPVAAVAITLVVVGAIIRNVGDSLCKEWKG